jgi:hypothetical protein
MKERKTTESNDPKKPLLIDTSLNGEFLEETWCRLGVGGKAFPPRGPAAVVVGMLCLHSPSVCTPQSHRVSTVSTGTLLHICTRKASLYWMHLFLESPKERKKPILIAQIHCCRVQYEPSGISLIAYESFWFYIVMNGGITRLRERCPPPYTLLQ